MIISFSSLVTCEELLLLNCFLFVYVIKHVREKRLRVTYFNVLVLLIKTLKVTFSFQSKELFYGFCEILFGNNELISRTLLKATENVKLRAVHFILNTGDNTLTNKLIRYIEL